MNYVDFFNAPDGFPLEADATLGFMQTDYQQAINGIAAIAGENLLVLSGCEESGNTVANGYMWLNGDLVRFVGGEKAEFIIIQETVVQKANQNAVLYDRYTTKVAQFGTGPGQITYSSILRLLSLRDIALALRNIARGSYHTGGNNWVILSGLGINNDQTGLNSGTALYNGQLVFASSLELLPSEGNPRYLTPSGTWTATEDSTYLKFAPFSDSRSEALRRKWESPKGTIMWSIDNQVQSIMFDGTGLGKYEWDGWALANGNNATDDLTGAISGLTAIQRI